MSILLTKGRPGVNAKRPSFCFFLHFFENFSTKRRLVGKRVKIRGLRRFVKNVENGAKNVENGSSFVVDDEAKARRKSNERGEETRRRFTKSEKFL
jgi:hypothetical protein